MPQSFVTTAHAPPLPPPRPPLPPLHLSTYGDMGMAYVRGNDRSSAR